MSKMCGNCSGDHAYQECPYVENSVTKERMTELLQKEEQYDIIRKKTNDGPFSTILLIDEALKAVKKLKKIDQSKIIRFTGTESGDREEQHNKEIQKVVNIVGKLL